MGRLSTSGDAPRGGERTSPGVHHQRVPDSTSSALFRRLLHRTAFGMSQKLWQAP